MSCYCATLGSDLCSGGFRCECECGVGSHVHIPPRGALRKGGVPSVKDTVEGHCTRPADLSCPAKDTHHDHWSPEVGACRHPNMCRSDCFDHNPAKDFVDARARYKFYLESCKNKLYC
ncbi:hypothetical protein AAG570_000188 [Ranatra chinensis]|uniref:Uncharacterized protein n=1 Tax=Ranatra chinensis TaxID=642074 RepID=A0ABD0YWZ4_9HEMI